VGVVTAIIGALRRRGGTWKKAVERLDQMLEGKHVQQRFVRTVSDERGRTFSVDAAIEAGPEIIEPLSDDGVRPILENAAFVDRFLNAFSRRGIHRMDTAVQPDLKPVDA